MNYEFYMYMFSHTQQCLVSPAYIISPAIYNFCSVHEFFFVMIFLFCHDLPHCSYTNPRPSMLWEGLPLYQNGCSASLYAQSIFSEISPFNSYSTSLCCRVVLLPFCQQLSMIRSSLQYSHCSVSFYFVGSRPVSVKEANEHWYCLVSSPACPVCHLSVMWRSLDADEARSENMLHAFLTSSLLSLGDSGTL